jgi:hypothetical protein
MQIAKFSAFCPLEIGDKVKSNVEGQSDDVLIVDDIIAVHSLKTGQATFMVGLIGPDGEEVTGYASDYDRVKEGATT